MNSIIMMIEARENGMTESEKNHFETYYGRKSYMPIEHNDLWDVHYFFLKEFTYAIQTMLKYYSKFIKDSFFRQRPREYYIDEYELESFTEESLLKLWEAIENLIEFKERLKAGWPYI